MLRYVPALLSLALTVYCVIDAFQTDEADMRNLPKVAWILLVVLLPVLGPVSWLLFGRPTRQSLSWRTPEQHWQDERRERDRRRPRGPDDDPDFLKDL